MEELFLCPPASEIADIPDQACPERFDQIVRLILQRKQAAPLLTTTTGLLVANWTPLLTEEDDTKVQGTPLFGGATIPIGEIRKTGGGDNSTINGMPILGGRNFVTVPVQLQDVEAAVRKAIRTYAADSALQPGFTNLTAYLVNRFGQIICRKVDTALYGIDIYNLYVSDTGSEGLGAANVNTMSFDLAPGWSDDVVVIKPTDFNPMYL